MHFFPLEHEHTLTDREFMGCCKACERSYKMVSRRLHDFCRIIDRHTPQSLRKLSPSELYSLYLTIDDIAHLECHHDIDTRIMACPEIRRMLPAIRRYYKDFFDIHETCLVNEVLSAKDPWKPLMDFGLYPRYKTLIETQMEHLSTPRPRRIAFIGSGPMPLSLILMHKLYNICSIGIDIDERAVCLAQKCVERLGMEEAIRIVHGDEHSLALHQWDMVVIAALAEPKSRIFSALQQIMSETESRPVICRTYSGLCTLLHPPIEEDDHSGFVIKEEIRPEKNRVNNTLLLLEMI